MIEGEKKYKEEDLKRNICNLKSNVAFFNTDIGIVHCMPDIFKFTETSFGNYPTGSPLSYQLQVNESFELITNIKKL